MSNPLMQTIEALAKEKGIEPDVVIGAIEDAVLTASRKYYKTSENLKTRFNQETGQVDLFAAADQACARAYPNLKARFDAFLAGLKKTPMAAKVEHPRTGKLEDVTVDYDGFVGALRGLLYIPELTSLVPLILDRAMSGDLGPFVTASVGLTGGIDATLSVGMFFSVICAEDAPFFDDEALGRKREDVLRQDLGRTSVPVHPAPERDDTREPA